MITHDLGVIAGMCSRVLVMYGGVVVEEGTVREIFYEPKHPYTGGCCAHPAEIRRKAQADSDSGLAARPDCAAAGLPRSWRAVRMP